MCRGLRLSRGPHRSGSHAAALPHPERDPRLHQRWWRLHQIGDFKKSRGQHGVVLRRQEEFGEVPVDEAELGRALARYCRMLQIAADRHLPGDVDELARRLESAQTRFEGAGLLT
jgi:hypothetical protein